MTDRLTVLIVGGYGTFGGRIVALLQNEPRLVLIIAGRSLERATSYCLTRRDASATLVPLGFDRSGDLYSQLASVRPQILVDASGPFQAYGEERYRVIDACIAHRINYMDLADGSDFVAGVRGFDAAARAAGLYVLSGVSSFPVLTAAVVRCLSCGVKRVDAIRGGIAPSPYAGVGENVIRAIAGYAGQSVSLRRNGKAATGHPFTEHMRFTIAPSGRLPLRSTLFSLVDVPDLHVLNELWPEANIIWMGAGPVPESLHRALIAFAWLVRFHLLATLSPLASLMHRVSNRLRWGEHRGGMFVEIEGMDSADRPIKRSWHLLAEGDDGPLIPSMAVEALIRRALDGRLPALGARAATAELELKDYESLFTGRAIYSGIREDAFSGVMPLYARLLGTSWEKLPLPIRALHDVGLAAPAKGRASVVRGSGVLARD
jgi:hypothetical protein